MWYSKHHYAAFLAKEHGVYFVSVPDRWRWGDLFSFNVKIRPTPEGVNVVEYRNNLPLRILPKYAERWVNRLNAWKLSRLPRLGKTLFWCFHPTPLLDHQVLRQKGCRVIYHVVDPYQVFPNDSQFAKRADAVAAINPWYVGYYQRVNPRTVLVPHGVRSKDRQFDSGKVAEYQARWGPYVIMAAGINHRTNYALLLTAAKHFPRHRLVLAGPLAPIKHSMSELRRALLAEPNVVHTGVLHPDELRHLIRGAEVGLVTYDFELKRSIPAMAGGTPLKVVTYLAQHCPVVSTINSYVPDLDGAGNFKAEDEAHFLHLMEQVLKKELTVDCDRVDAYLDEISYERLSGLVLAELPQGDQMPQLPIPSPPLSIPGSCPVLIISNEAWQGPQYSKHRYALALNDHLKVLFLDPSRSWRPSHLFRYRVNAKATDDGVTVLSYFNPIPLMGGRLRWLTDPIIAFRIKRYLRKKGLINPVVWSFDPSRLVEPNRLAPLVSIYHCVDDYAFGWGERSLSQKSDHVFCVAHDLMPRFRPFNQSIHFMPHGLTAADLAPVEQGEPDWTEPAEYGLYIGNINDRHDFALWEKLFNAHPDVMWLIVGPVRVTDPVGLRLMKGHGTSNVHFIGEVPYQQLRPLIAKAAFGFLFLRPEHPANRISSQKVVQFLTQGKPFFCSWLSEYADKSNLLYMSDSHLEALTTFTRWRQDGEDPKVVEERRKFVQSLEFEKLFSSLPFTLPPRS